MSAGQTGTRWWKFYLTAPRSATLNPGDAATLSADRVAAVMARLKRWPRYAPNPVPDDHAADASRDWTQMH